jgi:small subunit ribosomal protein S7
MLLKTCIKQVIPGGRICFTPSILTMCRFNSTKTENFSLTSKVYPLDKDSISEQHVDEWLQALQTLRLGKKVLETETEIYLNQLTKPELFLKEKFEPSEQQIAETQVYANKSIPLKYDPIIEYFTNLIMKHGKKSLAQKIMTRALYIVYLKTRQDPITILYETLDKMGPLVRTNIQKTGTAKARIVPQPLTQRQRNRYAITWILQGTKNKKSADMSVRLAEEIISVYEGKSSGYDKMSQMHKLAMQNRAFIKL